MARKSKRYDPNVFEFDQIERWGAELIELFKDVLPKNLKRVLEAEPLEDMEHARENLLAHMKIGRSDVAGRLRLWIESKRVAAYYGMWMTSVEYKFRLARPRMPSSASLSRAPFEHMFDQFVTPGPDDEWLKRRPRIFRIEIPGKEVSISNHSDIDDLPNVLDEILNAWAYWLADFEFSPADECLFVSGARKSARRR